MIGKIVPMFGGLFVLFAIVFLLKEVLIVKTVVCRYENFSACPEPVVAELTQMRGTSMITVTATEHKKKILAGVYNIDSIEEKKQYPSTLLVTLHTVPDAFVLFQEKQKTYVLVNERGKVTQNIGDRPEGVLIIVIGQDYAVGDTVPEELLHAGQTLRAFTQTSSGAGSTIAYKGEHTILVTLPQRITISLSSEGIDAQLNTLQFLLNEATIIEKAGSIESIDLRFDHPVIRYGQ